MKQTILYFFLAAVVLSCSKDKFETKPTLKVVSQSTEILPVNSLFRVTLEVTDKEGDVTDSIFVQRERLNIGGPSLRNPVDYKIPEFPKSPRAEIQLDLEYQNGLIFGNNAINIPGTSPQEFEPDTMNLKFWVKDAAGNLSDTVSTNVIVIR